MGHSTHGLIRRKLLRAVLAVATVMVVWLVVSPASAANRGAPVCDPRGAIGFAPPPQIQDEERSLDIPADCFEVSPLESRNVIPGSRATLEISFAQEPAARGERLLVHAPFVTTRLPVTEADAVRLPPGVRASLDRPPQS